MVSNRRHGICHFTIDFPSCFSALSLPFLAVQKGFFFQKNEAIPIARIQNVTLEAGPLLQWQELQQVNIETASTAHVIDGVTRSVADQLRNQILQLAQEARNE